METQTGRNHPFNLIGRQNQDHFVRYFDSVITEARESEQPLYSPRKACRHFIGGVRTLITPPARRRRTLRQGWAFSVLLLLELESCAGSVQPGEASGSSIQAAGLSTTFVQPLSRASKCLLASGPSASFSQ